MASKRAKKSRENFKEVSKSDQPIQNEEKKTLHFFPVDEKVTLGKALPLVSKDALLKAWKKVGQVEAISPQPDGIFGVFEEKNLLAEAVHQAFYNHYPLVLSPDIIWLTIAQGFAHHVNENAEALRKKFVNFKDKKKIIVSRPNFQKGSPKNDWPSVFPEFAQKIGTFIGEKTLGLISNDFSTTGPMERIVSQITVMDSMQQYFEYELLMGCGIPSIGLKGTVEDWQHVLEKAKQLAQFDLEWWTKDLCFALQQFVLAAQGKPDLNFWRAICNFSGVSGMGHTPITGWLQIFFPYLNPSQEKSRSSSEGEASLFQRKKGVKMNRNTLLSEYKKAYEAGYNVDNCRTKRLEKAKGGYGLKLDEIPPAIASAPFTWADVGTGKTYKMAFMGGITCLKQHRDTMALEPLVGWAVIEVA